MISSTLLLDRAVLEQPYDFYRLLREEAPVWVVTGADLVVVSTFELVAEVASAERPQSAVIGRPGLRWAQLTRRGKDRSLMKAFHPDLARQARLLPRGFIGPRTAPAMNALLRRARPKPTPGVAITQIVEPAPMRVYRPDSLAGSPGVALLWIHGGGFVIGNAAQDDGDVARMAKRLGILIASVDYRLAPAHPYPAPLDDCWAGLKWLLDQPDVEPSRIAVGGSSAGGGLAAAVAQLAHDRGVALAFQLLIYPMLDDRSGSRPHIDGHHHRLWNQKSNRFGWAAYLGQSPAIDPAVPARRADLSGLAPAWIGVGTHDLFHDEDVEYAERLKAAGVPCDLQVVDGAFHGFDRVSRSPLARGFKVAQLAALRTALGLSTPAASRTKAGQPHA